MTPAPAALTEASADYARMGRAIAWLRAAAPRQPSLEELAAFLDLSPEHCQRLFVRWAGISPKRFIQVITLEAVRPRLAEQPVLDAALACGLSGPGRLHELLVAAEAVTPGDLRREGRGLDLGFGWAPTPFGKGLFAWSARGLLWLGFESAAEGAVGPTGAGRDPLATLQARYPAATWARDDAAAADWAERAFPGPAVPRRPLALWVRGTNFQIQVWQALLRLPPGAVTTYTRLAADAGRPRSVRAVANAVGDNPLAWLIPCHRVLRTDGALGGYGYGLDRKLAMLAWEDGHRR